MWDHRNGCATTALIFALIFFFCSIFLFLKLLLLSLLPLPTSAKTLPLNGFSWASPAPDIVGVAAVNNTAETLFGRSRGMDGTRPPSPHSGGAPGFRKGSVDATRG